MIIKSQSFIKEDDNFIPLNKYSGILDDINYIEGAIDLKIDNVVLFDKELWDYVDSLWSYILWGLEELSRGEEYVTGFPGQPIEIHFRPLGDQFAEFKVEHGRGRRVRVEREKFITGMLVEAEKFFLNMREISLRSNGHDYAGALEKIVKIRNSL